MTAMPFSPAVAERLTPVSPFLRVIVAPATNPPFGSVTVILTAASCCAGTLAAITGRNKTRARTTRKDHRNIPHPSPLRVTESSSRCKATNKRVRDPPIRDSTIFNTLVPRMSSCADQLELAPEQLRTHGLRPD